jgi:predicted dehydrogenase
MAMEYERVLQAQGVDHEIVGRGASSAAKFAAETGRQPRTGGLQALLENGCRASMAIVATGVDQLSAATLALLESGAKRILVEKPAGLTMAEVKRVADEAHRWGADVRVGYNRRFYASTERARQIISEDGGVRSLLFEFTEWSHQVVAHHAPANVKERWLLANSTHVLDLAFHLGGRPARFSSYSAGGLPWHPHASVWTGAGVTETGAPFAYHANWGAPGRWSVEVLTAQRRLIFRPMEKLHVQRLRSVTMEEEPIDDTLDRTFKPGLFRQIEAFLVGSSKLLPDIHEQVRAISDYERIDRPPSA